MTWYDETRTGETMAKLSCLFVRAPETEPPPSSW